MKNRDRKTREGGLRGLKLSWKRREKRRQLKNKNDPGRKITEKI